MHTPVVYTHERLRLSNIYFVRWQLYACRTHTVFYLGLIGWLFTTLASRSLYPHLECSISVFWAFAAA